MHINHEVKGLLAKLLASENLVIEHKKVSTASFDVLRRVLTLPIWDKASETVYDLLVGHEVGHAIFTPNEDWREKITVPMSYVNVVEDARIEKLIKRMFPGLSRIFYNAYKELNEDNFFEIEDIELSTLSLIDRINLHFKIGSYSLIPFNANESNFITMIERAETFDEVLDICNLIYEYTKTNEDSKVNEKMLCNDIENEASGNSSSQSENMISGDDSNSASGITNMIPEQKESATPESGSDTNETNTSESGGGGESSSKSNEETSKTQEAFDKKIEQLSNSESHGNTTYYVEKPTIDINRIIVDCKILQKYINNCYQFLNIDDTLVNKFTETLREVDLKYMEYRKDSQKEVNYLVKDFEMKKSADAYQRTSTARTGVIDTSKLHSYKYNEDIFRKISVVPDGKNHGLIFILDWSGSMDSYLLDTVKQLFNLVWFCKKVQIPFEVYAFTYEWHDSFIDKISDPIKEIYNVKEGTLEVHRRFRLLNFISSGLSSKGIDTAMLNLWRVVHCLDRKTYAQYSLPIPSGLGLGGTPLNESILALHDIIPNFKQKNKIDKVNVVILSDGEANPINYDVNLQNRYGNKYNYFGKNYVSSANALRDRKIGTVYRNFIQGTLKHDISTILLENLKDNFPEVNIIGFRITSTRDFSRLYEKIVNDDASLQVAIKNWRKNKSYEINKIGYDALYAISSVDVFTNETMEVEDDSTMMEISKAFRDMLKKKSCNKKILSSFVSFIS